MPVAATSTLGFARVMKRSVVMILRAGVTATFSLAGGSVLLLLGQSSVGHLARLQRGEQVGQVRIGQGYR